MLVVILSRLYISAGGATNWIASYFSESVYVHAPSKTLIKLVVGVNVLFVLINTRRCAAFVCCCGQQLALCFLCVGVAGYGLLLVSCCSVSGLVSLCLSFLGTQMLAMPGYRDAWYASVSGLGCRYCVLTAFHRRPMALLAP